MSFESKGIDKDMVEHTVYNDLGSHNGYEQSHALINKRGIPSLGMTRFNSPCFLPSRCAILSHYKLHYFEAQSPRFDTHNPSNARHTYATLGLAQ